MIPALFTMVRCQGGLLIVTRTRTIKWTVEWVFLGQKHRTLVPENMTVQEAHDRAALEVFDTKRESDSAQSVKKYVLAAGVQLQDDILNRRVLSQELGPLEK